MTIAGFAETGTPRGGSWDGQIRSKRDKPVGANGRLADRPGTAPRRNWPNLTICRDFSLDTVGAVMRRRLQPRNRVLLCVHRLPPALRTVHRIVLAGVDAVLVQSDATARAVRAAGVPARRIVYCADPGDLALFAQPPRPRAGSDACRIIHVGDLEPEAGVADLLPCVVAWAERNPDRKVEIWWAGEGCLRGVLEAQPLPVNVLQQFPGRPSRERLASMFVECDMLAVPALAEPWNDVVSEAVTARLPVLGSSRCSGVTELITHGVTGWIFDPFEAGAMARTVDLALNTLPSELDGMRAAAAAWSKPPLPGLDARVRRAMRLEGAGPPFDSASLGFTL